MKMYDMPQSVEKYLNVELECDCGRTHYAPIKDINISAGAIERLPYYVKKYGYSRPYIICDRITCEIAGRRCAELLEREGVEACVHILSHMGFDEATLGEIVINKPDGCDVMIGCGTGSITDMLRYSSFKLSLPCFTVATAAPMDGFTASVGIMNVNNLKTTMPAHSSEVIIGDTDMLSSAPFRMTVAGYADLVAKLNSLNDWRLDRVVTGGHYCRKLDELVTFYVNDIISKTDRIRDRDPEALGDVMSALLLSGSTISLYGTSRGISGAEHHMSHYWDALAEQRGKGFGMHGEQVGVGTVLTLMMAEKLCSREIDFAAAREKAGLYSFDAWAENIRRAYGKAAGAIIALEEKARVNETENTLRRIESEERHWDEIRGILSSAFPSEKLRSLLVELGCPCDPKDIGVDEATLRDTLAVSKETRKIFTIMQLVRDLGLTEEISESIIADLRQRQAV